MKRSDLATLISLAALWGASYLFIRMGAGQFGAVPLAGARAALAALLLTPLLALRGAGGLRELRAHWKPIALVGITNSALPFVLFSFAALTLPAGLSSIFTAATPLFTAVIAWLWLNERLSGMRVAGLAVGFAGVLWLVWDKTALAAHGIASAHATTHTAVHATALAIAACLAATLLYGFSANFSKRRLGGVSPLAVATGSQIVSAVVLAVPAISLWPATAPAPHAWAALFALALACTAFAYVLFFRLIASVGPSRAMTALFLIPAFGVLWGALFLGETFTVAMAIGCGVILAGTALTTGVVRLPGQRQAPAARAVAVACRDQSACPATGS
ncbi:EamA family transporter [Paraburkholderia acidicola]|uniref:EamA family transporter n=1 Tax=Paraburkholderia acidicola TaxID=1912599 RepID=A0A2A4EMD5_9BURK|nr:DMT family transporter [Paraburkholderia acidicola]PCE21945.1 EamA family transporter [Paraburkholderia acidicola]